MPDNAHPPSFLMPSCLGIDPSLNATGICLYQGDPAIIHPELSLLTPPKEMKNQTLKLFWQRNMLRYNIERVRPDYLAIEKPFVLPMRSRGAGGEQSSNLWALYSLMLDVAREQKLPIACFHLSQLRSLIHGRGGTDKKDTIALAYEEGAAPLIRSRKLTDHEADAYFVSKYGHRFFHLFDTLAGVWNIEELKREEKIFLSVELTAKRQPKGMMYRPGDAWFDFRKLDPLESKWQVPL